MSDISFPDSKLQWQHVEVHSSHRFIEGAVVIGGGDVLIIRVKQTLLIVQQLGQHSADRLLIPKIISFS